MTVIKKSSINLTQELQFLSTVYPLSSVWGKPYEKCHRFWLRLFHAVILISNDRTLASKKINGMVFIRTLSRLLRSKEWRKNSMVFGRLRPYSHYTGSIIGGPGKPYRIGLLFTFDHAGPAQFLWRLRAGTLRFQMWYVPYRIVFWNAPLVVWTGKT